MSSSSPVVNYPTSLSTTSSPYYRYILSPSSYVYNLSTSFEIPGMIVGGGGGDGNDESSFDRCGNGNEDLCASGNKINNIDCGYNNKGLCATSSKIDDVDYSGGNECFCGSKIDDVDCGGSNKGFCEVDCGVNINAKSNIESNDKKIKQGFVTPAFISSPVQLYRATNISEFVLEDMIFNYGPVMTFSKVIERYNYSNNSNNEDNKNSIYSVHPVIVYGYEYLDGKTKVLQYFNVSIYVFV
jgi:hypothetical protein